ncbi:hypothetical protein FACS1894168_1740 [Deltaproteobacteria bacterium]|nr:hypothetical protein FACS1894168_1740 [Deltaproteobacteria bacterium]
MPVLTAPGVLGDLLKREYDRDYCREDVELVPSADGYKAGAVLGKVTANGKYALSTATGTTGEETACAVLLQDVPANGVVGLILARGPAIVADTALVFHSTVNTDALKRAKQQQLAAFGIVVRKAV